jgi:hypothetical protein
MFLATSYLTATQLKALPSDYDLSGYTDAQLDSMCVAATGYADSYMRRSYRAQERTIRYYGSGESFLQLEEKPLLYVKRVQLAIPATQGAILPTSQLLIDYEAGAMLSYTPMYWQGVRGYVFPRNVPVDVTQAWGCGYSVAKPPAITIAESQGTGLTPGAYNVAVTAKTFYGETSSPVQQYTTTSGVFVITPAPGLGVYLFRAYASPAANNTTLTAAPAAGATALAVAGSTGMTPNAQWLLGAGATAEVVTIASVAGSNVTLAAGLQFAHAIGEAFIPVPILVGESPFVAYGSTTLQITVNSLSAPANIWQDTLPTVDTSSPQVADGILEANRLLILQRIYEQNNLANRGIYQMGENTNRIAWKQTDGMSGTGKPLMVQQAESLLDAYAENGLYFA